MFLKFPERGILILCVAFDKSQKDEINERIILVKYLPSQMCYHPSLYSNEN